MWNQDVNQHYPPSPAVRRPIIEEDEEEEEDEDEEDPDEFEGQFSRQHPANSSGASKQQPQQQQGQRPSGNISVRLGHLACATVVGLQLLKAWVGTLPLHCSGPTRRDCRQGTLRRRGSSRPSSTRSASEAARRGAAPAHQMSGTSRPSRSPGRSAPHSRT